MSHPDTVSVIARELDLKSTQVQRLMTTLIHTRGFSRVVAVDHPDPADIQLTPEAAKHLRQMYGCGIVSRETRVSA